MGRRETRTQGALVAALRARPRTPYRADQCVLVAKASFVNSLLPGDRGRERRQLAVDGVVRTVVDARGPFGRRLVAIELRQFQDREPLGGEGPFRVKRDHVLVR